MTGFLKKLFGGKEGCKALVCRMRAAPGRLRLVSRPRPRGR